MQGAFLQTDFFVSLNLPRIQPDPRNNLSDQSQQGNRGNWPTLLCGHVHLRLPFVRAQIDRNWKKPV